MRGRLLRTLGIPSSRILGALTLLVAGPGCAGPQSALQQAVAAGNVSGARAALEQGAEIGDRDAEGLTPLHRAALNGALPIVQLLLDRGASAEATAHQFIYFKATGLSAAAGNVTPLHMASWKGHEAVARLLLDRGAPIEAKDSLGQTALYVAVAAEQIPVVELLLQRGADVQVKTRAGHWKPDWQPLHEAALSGNLHLMQLLIKYGAPIDADALLAALVYDTGKKDAQAVRAAEFLINAGAPVNPSGPEDATPLHFAAMRGNVALVQHLLERGAVVDAKRQGSTTPLHYAAEKGHLAVVRLLLEHGADWSLVSNDTYGMKGNPRELAEQKGHKTVARLLEKVEEAALQAKAGPAGPGPAAGLTAPPPVSDVDRVPAVKVSPKKRAYAVVIGIEQYREKLPRADFADRDARLVSDYLTKVLGYPEENVVVRLNEKAAKTDLEKYFGDWLRNNVEPGGSVFIYYSGHGAPNPTTSDAYLVPYDGDPTFIDTTGFPLKRLYAALEKLPAADITVVLDACFSGAGGRSVLAKGARPIVLSLENTLLAGGKTVVLAASSGNQISSTFQEQGHGLFTYFLLKGLQGDGDLDHDGAITLSELYDYAKPNVQKTARKQYNNEQTPQLLGSPDVLNRTVLWTGKGRP